MAGQEEEEGPTHSLHRLDTHWGRDAAVQCAKALFLLNGAEAGNNGAKAAASMAQLRAGFDHIKRIPAEKYDES